MGLFRMPALGADMEAGTLVEWLKQPGDSVARGDIMAVVETDKGAIEIEAFQAGVMEKVLVEIGTRVPVGTPLAMIAGEAGEEEEIPPPEARAEAAPPPPPPPVARPVIHDGRPRATPAARARALQEGIDLATIHPTGADGAIVLADVVAAIERPEPARIEAVAAPPARAAGQTGMRAAIAAAMAHSKRDIPHYYLAHTVDLTAAETFVAAQNADRPPEQRLLIAALFIKAVAHATRKHKDFNGHFENGAFTPSTAVHAGFAINIRGGGLVAPAIHDAETLGLDPLMERLRDLVARVRAGRFRAAELSDPTITISSLGERGVEQLYGVIYPPQVAILGFGSPSLRAMAVEDRIEPRRTVTVTLAADHRVSDGHAGALFLHAIANALQQPETL